MTTRATPPTTSSTTTLLQSTTTTTSSSSSRLAKRQSSSLDHHDDDDDDEEDDLGLDLDDDPIENKNPLQHPQSSLSSSSSSSSTRRSSRIKSRVTFLFLLVLLIVAAMELDWMEILSWTTQMASGSIQSKHEYERNNNNIHNNNSSQQPQLSPLSSVQSSSSSSPHRSYVYTRRGRSMTVSETEELSRTWGTWTCTNRRSSSATTILEDHRPPSSSSSLDDFYSLFDNRDVPLDQFPSTAWQRNATYVTEFLQQALSLVNRTMEAILVEYGKGARFVGGGGEEENDEWNTKLRWAMFDVDRFENDYFTTTTTTSQQPPPKIYDKSHGGWTTRRTWIEGLQRRLWHAILTEDTFVVVVGGHSAAAGQGNQFLQSYALQVQRILEPVLARLGVAMEARNMAHGGLGTFQTALASTSLYGPDVDFLVWDSGMTEPSGAHVDLFARQGLLRPSSSSSSSSSLMSHDTNVKNTKKQQPQRQHYHFKVPILWNLQPWSILTELHDHAYVDVGGMFSGSRGVGRATTLEDIDPMPYAVRYMKCEPALDNAYCKAMEYNGTCWIHPESNTNNNNNNNSSSSSTNNNNIPIPPTRQRDYPGGRATWHPGFRKHQLMGRILTMTILRALYDALGTWQEYHQDALRAAMETAEQQQVQESTSFLLPADYWHVSDHYQKIQAALTEVIATTTTSTTTETSTTNDENEPLTTTRTSSSPKFTSPCFELADKIPARVCQLSLRGRSEYTPRAYPSRTSIRTLMPLEMRRRINDPEPNLYDPPDLYNPFLDPPPHDSNAINVLSIVEGGTDFEPLLYSRSTVEDVASSSSGGGGGGEDLGDGRGPLEYYDIDNTVASSSMPLVMPDRFEPGRGIFLNTVPGADDLCDGTYTSFCNRGPSNDCLLGGMNDYRGGLHFDCLSGWLIFNVPRVMHGIIMIKLETYHEASPLTEGWTSINNNNINTISTATTSEEGKVGGKEESRNQDADESHHQEEGQRSLQSDKKKQTRKKNNEKKGPPESDHWCDEFAFEYALNGNVTKWNKVEFFDQHLQTIQRTLSIVTLLDDDEEDDSSTTIIRPSNIQVAIRITGCGRNNNNNNQGFQLTHVYWA